MPEVWLNYGAVDTVMDIRAENLGDILEGNTTALEPDSVDKVLSKVGDAATLVVLHDTAAVRQIISRLYGICEDGSGAFPRVLADGYAKKTLASGLPEGVVVETFGAGIDHVKDDLVFVADMEPDGLFGYNTVCTRLMRRFAGSKMLEAYENRDGDAPVPGCTTVPYGMAQEFAEQFDVSCIDVAGGRGGICGIYAGHPSKCDAAQLAEPYASNGAHSATVALGSSGRVHGADTLARSLPSLWALWGALKRGGQAILLAECGGGLGSEALVRHSEGRLNLERPEKYVAGMEDVLFATTMTQSVDVSMVTALPDMYARRLSINPARQTQGVLHDILHKNPRRKITILPDAGRTILRQDAGGKGGAKDG